MQVYTYIIKRETQGRRYKMKEMLNYYGYETIEEFSEAVGMNPVDAKRLLVEMYEEDTAPLATY